ncbi:RNA-guided endonuclease TnpB family protein, partial [Cohnella sp.]|uniref:RNA-guided endonuclease TnpB family protein n=1 Tax=Cohnella sp. TaxID=1883426 RepID=UPI003561F3D6
SLVCEVNIVPLVQRDTAIGIDFGLKKFAVCSSGEERDNPRHLRKHEKRLIRWQRILSRRKQGGTNWRRAKRKVAMIHEKIMNSRQDFLHQLTTRWIRENQTICLEDLQVEDMLQNERLAKAISEVSWSMCRRMLEYKAKWYGRTISVVAKDYPSSQLCSSCGLRNPDVKSLGLRTWDCPACGVHHDRDRNASMNIEKEGLRLAAMTA